MRVVRREKGRKVGVRLIRKERGREVLSEGG